MTALCAPMKQSGIKFKQNLKVTFDSVDAQTIKEQLKERSGYKYS